MNRRGFIKNCFLGALFSAGSSGCKDVFEYSPYENRLEEKYLNTNRKNLERLSKLESQFMHQKRIKVALTADNHAWYDDLGYAVDAVNSIPEVDFLLHAGDLTDWGLEKEYEFAYRQLKRLNMPFLTVVGNHDYLAFGADIYKDMFGKMDYVYSLTTNEMRIKFIFWNNIVWERRNNPPNFDWLENNLQSRENYDYVFVICHIPPYTDQFLDNGLQEKYVKLMDEYKVDLSIHGHNHNYEYYPADDPYYEGVKTEFLVIGSPKKHYFCTLEIEKEKFSVEKIDF